MKKKKQSINKSFVNIKQAHDFSSKIDTALIAFCCCCCFFHNHNESTNFCLDDDDDDYHK
jgi:hypothetical protein